jgi:DNA-binding transcriptional LysR family regulator
VTTRSAAGPGRGGVLSGRRKTSPTGVFGTRLTRTPELVVPDLRSVAAAVLAGAGASVLPTYLCASHLAAGTLHALTHPEIAPLNTIFVAHRPAALGQAGVATVHSRLMRHFGSAPE